MIKKITSAASLAVTFFLRYLVNYFSIPKASNRLPLGGLMFLVLILCH